MSSYKIVYSRGSSDDEHINILEAKVKELLAMGWSCIGGVVVCYDGPYIIRMYQTMVKMLG